MSEKLTDALREEALNWLQRVAPRGERIKENNMAAALRGLFSEMISDAFSDLADRLDKHSDELRQEPGGVENNAPGTDF